MKTQTDTHTQCGCPEMKMETQFGDIVQIRVQGLPYASHNCDYTRERSALVGRAEFIADQSGLEDGRDGEKIRGNRWSRLFAETMEKLAAPIVKKYQAQLKS